jgi:iron(III) transport system ATP-binding protein
MPRLKRPSKKVIEERVGRVLDVMELGKYAQRHATKLSGGQQQRLALARAIVTEPDLLLLDEPVSNLDAKLRESLRFELKRLQRELGITSIYVTHDQTEALALSTKIAVMSHGNIQQLGRPREIYENPSSKFVAEFIGTANFVKGTIAARDGAATVVDTEHGRLIVDADAAFPVGSEVITSIRPESIHISADEPTDRTNVWHGTVVTRSFLGDAIDHIIAVGGRELRVRSAPAVSIEPDSTVYCTLDRDKISFVPLD